jgi:hypothetical protein
MQLSRADTIRMERQRVITALYGVKHPEARRKGNAKIAELEAELQAILSERAHGNGR